jgi:molybdopterin biosynthesis enzyme
MRLGLKRRQVAILATGDELVPPGDTGPDQIVS